MNTKCFKEYVRCSREPRTLDPLEARTNRWRSGAAVARALRRLVFSFISFAGILLAVRGQGLLGFNTAVVNAPASLADGRGPGASMLAGVYLVQGGESQLIGTTPFRTDGIPEAKYIRAVTFAVPGVPPGASALFRFRVWPVGFPTFEAAVAAGACVGEWPTTTGDGVLVVGPLGDPNPPGSYPIKVPLASGLLPLELPCVLAKGSTTNLLPAIRVKMQPATNSVKLEVLTGFLGKATVLQASTNLPDWFNVATNVPSTNRYTIEDVLSSQQPWRLYRTLVPNP